MVKLGIKSENGKISSRKVNPPATFPKVPLYIQVIKKPARGAQITSENSPIPGIVNESIPIQSKKIPKINFLFLLFLTLDILSICTDFFMMILLKFNLQNQCQLLF